MIYQLKDKSSKLKADANFPLSTFHFGLKYDFIVHPGGDPSLIKLRTHWVEDLNIKPDGSLTLISSMGSITENPPISFQEGKTIATQFKREGNTLSFQLADYDKTQTLVLDPSIAWSTHYGGTGDEIVFGIKADAYRNAYMGGSTTSSTFIASGGHLNTYSGASSMDFLVKFNRDGRRLWATYYPGESFYSGGGVSIDSTGNAYLVGVTMSNSGIATSGTFQTSYAAPFSGYVVKFNPNGTRLWGTYYNGFGIQKCEIGKDNQLVVAGRVQLNSSTNPTATAGTHKQTHSGGKVVETDIFIAKLNESGNRIWATYYGGEGNELISDIAIDNLNNIAIVGSTTSVSGIALNGFINTQIPKTVACDIPESKNTYLSKFTNSGQLLWGTYYYAHYGCTGAGGKVAIDKLNNIYLCIGASDTIAAVSSSFLNTYASGKGSGAALIKFNETGSRLWGRFITDTNYGATWTGNSFSKMICDDSNNVYGVGGVTFSNSSYLILNAFQSTKASLYEGYIASYSEAGLIKWGSFFGGKGSEGIHQISINKNGEIFFAGNTDSTVFTKRAFQSNVNGGISHGDAFVVKLCGILDTPKIEISSNRGTSICGGGQVIFTATDTFEGDDPIYTWYKNGNPVGMDTNTLTMASIQDKDSFRCRLISSATCLFKDTAWSNTLVMKIKAADTQNIYDTMCELQSYWFNNQNVYSSGLYKDTFTSSQGCDSFVFLHLHVKDTSYNSFAHITPCDPNASFMFNGLARTQSGVYSAKYFNALGCDSAAVLNLTIRKPSTPSQFEVRLCPGDSFYFGSVHRKDSGDYPFLLTNSLGCDSLITLRLRPLKKPLPESNTIQACSPFSFLGKTYTSSTIVLDTIKSIVGNCDSVYLSNLIQLKPPPITAPEVNIIVCDSIRLNNRLYTTSFSFVDTFRTVGTVCDSVYRKTNYTIRSTPQIGLKERDTFMRGSQVTLRPFSATNYLWSTGQTTKDISFKLTEDRQLYIIAWNEEPCRDTAYISLVAEDLAIVGMPTGFSPTGEYPENRTLRPNINGRLEYFHLMVFNRWGEKVYETFDTQPLGWNGIFKGEPAPAGLYGYVMEYRTLGSIFTKSGEVMLVR